MDGRAAQWQMFDTGGYVDVLQPDDNAISESAIITVVRACDQQVTFEEAFAPLAVGAQYADGTQHAGLTGHIGLTELVGPTSLVDPERRVQPLPFSYSIDSNGGLHSEREVMKRALAAYHWARHPHEFRAATTNGCRQQAADAGEGREEGASTEDVTLEALVNLQGAGRRPREVLRDLIREVQTQAHRKRCDSRPLTGLKGTHTAIDRHLVEETARRMLTLLLATRLDMLRRRDVRDQWWNWCLLFHPQQNRYCFSVMTHWHSAKVVPMEPRAA